MMVDYNELLDRIRGSGREIWVAGPQPAPALAALEQALGVKLPPSYRDFVVRFGALTMQDSAVSGIMDEDAVNEGFGWLYGDTLRCRQEFGLPEHLLVVQPDEGAPYCLDTRRPDASGEMPVVCYELHSGHERKIADDFASWLENWFFDGVQ
ncbi:MAG: SMI1/KNR4 family protein [Planctomycetes bacterium]|nr:SMI1/KNR4 family protein [Planctomycetota bacterium]